MSKRVKDVIATWTSEERKKFAVLIKECYGRELMLNEISEHNAQAVLALKEAETKLQSNLSDLSNSFESLRSKVESLYDSSLELYLMMVTKGGEV